MAGDTTFTFLDAASNVKTARAGSDAGGNLAPSAVLYDVNGAVLIGQKARAASLPVTVSVEDATLIGTLATQTTLAAVLAKLSSDPATQTTLAAILAKIIAAPATEAKQDALAALIGEVQASPTANTLLDRLKTIASALADTLAISAASLPLPSGAATEATLAAINTKTPALGQAVAGSSVPVVLPAAQITTLTPPAAITGYATESTLSTLNTKVAAAKTADYDSGAGTDTVQMIGMALPKSGGAVAGGTSSDPIRTDPTGTTAQPVTDNGGSLTVDGTVAASNLPATVDTNSGAKSASTIRTVMATDDPTIGATNETAPATDTASSGLNGRLQRIAQNLSTLFGRFVAAATLADSTSAPSTTIVGAVRMDYNGTTLDLARNNVEGTVLASAARTATNTVDFTNYNGKGLALYVNVTVAGTSTLIIQLYGKDPVSANYFQINNNPTAISTTGQYGYMFAISGTAPAGSDVKTFWQIVLPRTLRVRVVHGDSSSWTYSIGYALS